jgi:16S rRNA (uracil1498-N3)-methyltransferase
MARTHSKPPRLFVAFDLGAGIAATLESEQAHYLATVLRREPGDLVVLFNGRDGAWLAQIAASSRKGVSVAVTERLAPQPAAPDLWYGFAPLKSARLDYVVEKATEMGAGAIQPVLTRYTQVTRLREDKLRANIVEAAEQCEVLAVPALLASVTLEALVAGWPERHGDRMLVFCDEAAPSASPLGALAPLAGRRVGLLVGPEGGFAPEERALLLAQPFVVPVSLGPRILRADTAAVAALAVMQACIGDWR